MEKNGCRKFKFAFVSIDAHGHINSMMGLADQLKKLGHRTIFVSANSLIPRERGHEVRLICEQPAANGKEKAAPATVEASKRPEAGKTEGEIFLVEDLNRKWAKLIDTLDYRVSDKEKICEALTNNYKISKAFHDAEILALDDKLEEIILDIKPDLVFLDLVSSFPAIHRLSKDVEYAKSRGLEGALRWFGFLSCNPMVVYHCYGVGSFPPPLMGLSSGGPNRLTGVELEIEQLKYERCMKEAGIVEQRREQAIKGHLPEAREMSELELLFSEFALNISPEFNIYMFPRELDYSLDQPVKLPAHKWIQVDSLIRETGKSLSSSDLELLNSVERWRSEKNCSNQQELKIIYVSLGTTMSLNLDLMGEVLRQMFNCLEKHENWKFLIPLGARSEQLPSEVLKKLQEFKSANRLLYNGWWPQPELLRRKLVDCCVTHGGNNTICELFQFQVPHLVVVSGIHDQLDNARRVADLKIGVGFGLHELLPAAERGKQVAPDLLEKALVEALQLSRPKTESSAPRDGEFCARAILAKLAGEECV